MTRILKDDRAHEAIVEQASAWFLRHRSGELSRAEKGEFLEWLRASKLNLHEYFEQVRLHQAFAQTLPGLQLDRAELEGRAQAELRETVLPLGLEALSAPREAPRPRFSRSSRRLSALAAALLLATSIAWVFTTHLGTQRITVPHGEQRIVQLPDGSTMHVNVSSRVEVKYSKTDRVIELEAGQAFFEVARDATRLFRVRAGSIDVVAVGTQFDVYRRKDENIVVTVLEGKVDVIAPQRYEDNPEVATAERRVRVAAGEQVQVGRTEEQLAARPVDARATTAWLQRRVIFNGQSLEQVAAELNRYIAVPVYIEDENLKKMRVRAVFNAYDAESFLAFLRQYDVELDVGETAIHVRERGSLHP